ncbi:MAG: hypothetical protein JW900_09525 [Anaerolineae bacterium]|nr:hypothetical protein [Anaerolineae bacterium]
MKRFLQVTTLILAILLATVSLVANGFLMYGLGQARVAALQSIAMARNALADLQDHSAEISIPFQQTFPIHARVPLQEEFIIPIQTTLPVSTVVQVPIAIPVLGTYEVAVPVEAVVPINLEVAIPFSRTIDVDLQVDVDTSVPFQVSVSQMGLEGLFEQIDRALAEIEQGLRWPER